MPIDTMWSSLADNIEHDLLHDQFGQVSYRKSRSEEKTGTDKNRRDYISDMEYCCIMIISS